jgi:hypothetical protein
MAVEPENKALKSEQARINAALAKEKEKAKRMAQRMFAGVGKEEEK